MSVVIKPKRRNSEKRKEKSRDAARTRRSRESEVFAELSCQLPIPQNSLAQLDKASIVRLGIVHLRLRQLLQNANFSKLTLNSSQPSSLSHSQKVDQFFSRALDGFLMLVSGNGTLVYVTENVNHHLGLAQVDLLGRCVYDFIHPCDHDELEDFVSERNGKATNPSLPLFIRMQCTLTSKGRSVNIKSASYKVIQCSRSVISTEKHKVEPLNLSRADKDSMSFTLLLCRSMLHPSHSDYMLLDSRMFISHHNMDMSFAFCDDRVGALLGYRANDMLGKSLYKYHHVLDSEAIEKSYKTLFSKGQCVTGLYRFLVSGGGYVWVETHASIVDNSSTKKAQMVICIHSVVSDVECRSEVFSTVQQESSIVEDLINVVRREEAGGADIEMGREEGAEEEEEEEEDGFDDEAIFMTEKILCSANKESNQVAKYNKNNIQEHCPVSSSLQSPSDKFRCALRLPAVDVETSDYRRLAPYISVEDTAFDAEPLATSENEITSTQSNLVNSDMDEELTSQSENYLEACLFGDLLYNGEYNVNAAGQPANIINLLPKGTVAAAPPGSKTGAGVKMPADKFDLSDGSNMHFSAFDSYRLNFSDVVYPSSVGSSVLKNLLLKGEDINYGYRLLDSSSDLNSVLSHNMSSGNSAFSSAFHCLPKSKEITNRFS